MNKQSNLANTMNNPALESIRKEKPSTVVVVTICSQFLTNVELLQSSYSISHTHTNTFFNTTQQIDIQATQLNNIVTRSTQ